MYRRIYICITCTFLPQGRCPKAKLPEQIVVVIASALFAYARAADGLIYVYVYIYITIMMYICIDV